MSKRLALQMALRGSFNRSGVAPTAVFKASRIGMTNRYAHDFACEDEYFEREMTLLDSKLTTLPLPTTWRHKELPMDDIMPLHWNDVRFNFKPENIDRRMFLHDNYAILYDMHNDYYHGVGYQDEDMDETLLKESGLDNEPTIWRFQSLVDSLLWITRCCRPDIGFAVYRVTKKAHALTIHDWKMAKIDFEVLTWNG